MGWSSCLSRKAFFFTAEEVAVSGLADFCTLHDGKVVAQVLWEGLPSQSCPSQRGFSGAAFPHRQILGHLGDEAGHCAVHLLDTLRFLGREVRGFLHVVLEVVEFEFIHRLRGQEFPVSFATARCMSLGAW